MNIARTNLLSNLKPRGTPIPTQKHTINLSILETQLLKCRSLKQLKQIHSQMIISGFINDTFAASKLLRFCANSPLVTIEYSRCLLDQIKYPNGFIWNTMMKAYLLRSSPGSAILLYKSMLQKDFEPDTYTYPILIQACTLLVSEKEGEEIHNHVLKTGFDLDLYVQNTLINMYAVCGNLRDARKVFDKSPNMDSITWNSILAAYVRSGDVDEAVNLFDRMPAKNMIASNSMIALYARSGRIIDGRKLFDEMHERDVVSWSAMISCYEQNERFREALELFSQMNGEGISVDDVAIVSILSACAALSALKEGEVIHGLIVKIGFESYVNLRNALINLYSKCGRIIVARQLFDLAPSLDHVSWNSLISGYLKCGLVEEARKLFDCMTERDVVSWCTMISGYAQHDNFSETLALFHEMQHGDVTPDEITLVSVISACAHLSALDQGRWVHAYINKNNMRITAMLGATLINMYMKCGCIDNALEIFHAMEKRGVSTWNAVIFGLAMNGWVEESLEKYSEMKKCGARPNEITFVGVLGACRHAGLVDEGLQHFNSMKHEHAIEPNLKHYGCMVDLLGRAGFLKEAEELIESMPIEPDVATWGALLGACRKHGNDEIGERAGQRLTELEPYHSGCHVLLSNLYASKGRWDDVLGIRGMMKELGVVKAPGCSLIEANGVVHEFVAGDRGHPQIEDIDSMLNEMARRLKMEGYEPETAGVALDIDEEEKEIALYRHSEKLAIAFGLISTSPPVTIRIMKNLRTCGDCHTMAKLVSRVFGREIVVRDRHRFHHFKQGSCSCVDYW